MNPVTAMRQGESVYLMIDGFSRCANVSLTSLPGSVELARFYALLYRHRMRASVAMTEGCQ